MEKSQQDQLLGLVLSERFKIIKLIGRGGMANVYQGLDLSTQTTVALKILKAEYVRDMEFVQRFDAEAKSAASLNHPNIVKVYGVGEHHGIRYIVMQYIQGVTLKEWIEEKGRLEWPLALSIAIQVAQALQEAHLNGIIHRDIKPHNIMVTPTQQALVTDFGIARAQNTNMITMTGASALGSVHYFSPEQARGGFIQAGADIYSWGIMFYEMLTGILPFDGDSTVSVVVMHLQEEAKPPHLIQPSIPLGLSKIIMKCLRKNPKERYLAVEDLIKELFDFRKNPEGHYGVIEYQEAEHSDLNAFAHMNYIEINNFDRVKNIEKSIQYRRQKRRIEILVTLFFVILILVGSVVGISYLLRSFSVDELYLKQEESVPVLGNYLDKPLKEVAEELEQQDIAYKIVKRKVKEEELAGIILEQNLPVNTKMTSLQRNPLILTVGDLIKSIKIPDLTNKSLEEAQIILDDLGVNFKIQTEHSDVILENKVIRTEPNIGSSLNAGQTLTLYLSKGEEEVLMPSLEGMRLEVAQEKLEELGLIVGEILDHRSSEFLIKRVSKSSVKAGEKVKKGSSIDLTLE